MDYRLDDIDRRILYHLVRDARKTSAPDIADEVNVSPGTIRNRIKQLEQYGVVQGYHAHVDYERADGLLTNLFVCDASVFDRESLAKQVLEVPGVVNVREIMSGRGTLQVKAVGEDTDGLTRIARQIEELGITIEDEDLIQREYTRPYLPFGPENAPQQPVTSFMSLAGEAEVIDLTVTEDAPVAGESLSEANELGLIDDEVLVVAIERDGEVLTPKGRTKIEAGDVVSLFSPAGVSDDIVRTFTAEGSVSRS